MTRLRAYHVAIILIAGIFIYAGTLHHTFQFDDAPNIIENQAIKEISTLLDMKTLFDSSYSSRIIGYLSFALNYSFHGLSVEGYHILNIALHLINSLLVYWLVISFNAAMDKDISVIAVRKTSMQAFFAAILFAGHPVQTQAVTYIVQRFTVLATMFYILSVIFYIKGRTANPENIREDGSQKLVSKKAVWFFLSFISALLAFRSKEISLTLPFAIALCEYSFFKGHGIKRFMRAVPLLLIVIVIGMVHIGLGTPLEEITRGLEDKLRSETSMARSDYLITQSSVLVTYLRLIFLPVNQNFDYNYPIYNDIFDPNILFALILLSSLIAAGFYLLRSSGNSSLYTDVSRNYFRLISFGIFWFFITLSVESSIIPIVDVINEHRLYLPSIGVFISLSGLAGLISNRLYDDKKIAMILIAIVILALAIASVERNRIWKTEMALWSDVITKSPEKARGYYNLGHSYSRAMQYDLAIEYYSKAVTFNPKHIKAYLNRGNAYDETGQTYKAMQDFERALAINPKDELVYYNRGVTYYRNGLLAYALADFEKACRLGYEEACRVRDQIKSGR